MFNTVSTCAFDFISLEHFWFFLVMKPFSKRLKSSTGGLQSRDLNDAGAGSGNSYWK